MWPWKSVISVCFYTVLKQVITFEFCVPTLATFELCVTCVRLSYLVFRFAWNKPSPWSCVACVTWCFALHKMNHDHDHVLRVWDWVIGVSLCTKRTTTMRGSFLVGSFCLIRTVIYRLCRPCNSCGTLTHTLCHELDWQNQLRQIATLAGVDSLFVGFTYIVITFYCRGPGWNITQISLASVFTNASRRVDFIARKGLLPACKSYSHN